MVIYMIYRLLIKFKSGGDNWGLFGSKKEMLKYYEEIKGALSDFNEHKIVEVIGHNNNACKSEVNAIIMIEDITAIELSYFDG